MHSTDVLQGGAFEIEVDGCRVDHALLFQQWTVRDRLAVYAPGRVECAGAVNLLMAHVTAFYDAYRRAGEPFFAYPDFFVFYRDGAPPACHMLDVYPNHKVVRVGGEAIDVLRAATDRGVGVLLVPDVEREPSWTPSDSDVDRLAMASARRTIGSCYAYRLDGQPRDADMTVTVDAEPMIDWLKPLFDSVADDPTAVACADRWLADHPRDARLAQGCRRITLDEAIALL